MPRNKETKERQIEDIHMSTQFKRHKESNEKETETELYILQNRTNLLLTAQ
jgi:hypothetical protein